MTKLEITQFLKQLSSKEVFIYGVGGDGTLIFHILEVNEFRVKAFIVDDSYRIMSEYRGVPIITITEFSSKLIDKDVSVLVAMNSNPKKKDTIKLITEQGIKFCVDCDKEVINDLLLYNCEQLLQLNQIDIGGELIRFKNSNYDEIIFPNPFHLTPAFISAFIYEMPDILMPEINTNFQYFNEGKYEYGEVIIKKGDIVMDCGANIGIFSAIAAAKGAFVYAFEPASSVLPCLNQLTSYYNQLFPQQYALSNFTGEVDFLMTEDDTTSGSIIINKTNDLKDTVVTVPCITLDEFVRKNDIVKVDFIKADIEGAERFMLEGAKNIMRKFGPKIAICTYHLPDDRDVLTEIILAANPKYKIRYMWKKMYAYIPE